MSWLFSSSKKYQEKEQEKEQKIDKDEIDNIINDSNKKIHRIDGDCYITGFLYVGEGASFKGNVITETISHTSTSEFRHAVDWRKMNNYGSKKFLDSKFIPITNNDLIEKINELEKRDSVNTEKINELEKKINNLINHYEENLPGDY